jgi:hypothetical protein
MIHGDLSFWDRKPQGGQTYLSKRGRREDGAQKMAPLCAKSPIKFPQTMGHLVRVFFFSRVKMAKPSSKVERRALSRLRSCEKKKPRKQNHVRYLRGWLGLIFRLRPDTVYPVSIGNWGDGWMSRVSCPATCFAFRVGVVHVPGLNDFWDRGCVQVTSKGPPATTTHCTSQPADSSPSAHVLRVWWGGDWCLSSRAFFTYKLNNKRQGSGPPFQVSLFLA